jgi:hypothetical protein
MTNATRWLSVSSQRRWPVGRGKKHPLYVLEPMQFVRGTAEDAANKGFLMQIDHFAVIIEKFGSIAQFSMP